MYYALEPTSKIYFINPSAAFQIVEVITSILLECLN
jgi:hypothetical protein